MKVKICFVSAVVTRKIASAYMKKISGWRHPLIEVLNEIFDVETCSWNKFLHYDVDPFKTYFAYALYMPLLTRKLKQCDIIVVQGYPAIIEVFISLIIGRLTKKVVIVQDTHWYWPQTLKSKLLFPIYIRMLRYANGIFVPGTRAYMWWLKLGFKPFLVHYYWLEAEMAPCKNPDKYAKFKRPYTLLYLGRLISKRAVDLVIRAFHDFIKDTNADTFLLIAGEGPLKSKLKKIVEELNLGDRVIFLGPVPESEKKCLYKIADVFIYVPVKTDIPEEWPIPVLEALKAGVPVIVSDIVGSIPDIRDGLIVIGQGDVKALREAITLCFKNPSLLRSLAQRGQRKAMSITRKHVCREFLEAILDITKRRHKN